MSTTTLGQLNYAHQQEQRALDTIGAVVSKAIAGRNGLSGETVFSRLRPNSDVRVVHKAGVPALSDSTVDPTFAPRGLEVLGLYRQRTVLGRLAGVRRVPPLTRTYALTGGATGTWMIEGYPDPRLGPGVQHRSDHRARQDRDYHPGHEGTRGVARSGGDDDDHAGRDARPGRRGGRGPARLPAPPSLLVARPAFCTTWRRLAVAHRPRPKRTWWPCSPHSVVARRSPW